MGTNDQEKLPAIVVGLGVSWQADEQGSLAAAAIAAVGDCAPQPSVDRGLRQMHWGRGGASGAMEVMAKWVPLPQPHHHGKQDNERDPMSAPHQLCGDGKSFLSLIQCLRLLAGEVRSHFFTQQILIEHQ